MQAIFAILFASTILVQSTVNGDYTPGSIQCLNESVCTTPGCVHAASEVLKNMDPSVQPCDDFYKFACGGFIKRTVLTDDKTYQMSFNIISDQVQQQLRTILEEPIKDDEPRPFVLLKKLYNVCLNTELIEKDGLGIVQRLLRKLGGYPVLEGSAWIEDGFDWKELMYKLRENGLPTRFFLNLYVGSDTKNSSRRMINIDEAALPLDRDFLIEGFENKMVKAYYDYLVGTAVILGAERKHAEQELRESMQFAIKLAEITLAKEDRRNLSALYNPMTVTQLQEHYTSIPWLEYINSVIATSGLQLDSEEYVDLGVPTYVSKLEKLLAETPKRAIANYILAKTITILIPTLSKELRNREMKYREITDGVHAMKARWKECVDVVTVGMDLAAGALYVRNYFKEDAKNKAKTLASDVQSTFIDLLKQIDWMDESTRKIALEKAEAVVSNVGYPQELLDDKKLEEHYANMKASDKYLDFMLKVRKFSVDNSFKKLREVVDKTDWKGHGAATKVNAYYNNLENSILLPAGILQGAFFDSERPNYMNYGSMGYVIGHEITHGFDDTGSQFSKEGEVQDWWAEDTKQAFVNKTQCIIDQYSSYVVPEVNLTLNGVLTLGENIADNGGIKEAYLAYQTWMERNGPEPTLPGLNYTPKQLFWISAANLWCAKERKEYLRQTVYSDAHSPSYFRVVGSLSNSEHFSEDFNCPLGSKMNPEHKCKVW